MHTSSGPCYGSNAPAGDACQDCIGFWLPCGRDRCLSFSFWQRGFCSFTSGVGNRYRICRWKRDCEKAKRRSNTHHETSDNLACLQHCRRRGHSTSDEFLNLAAFLYLSSSTFFKSPWHYSKSLFVLNGQFGCFAHACVLAPMSIWLGFDKFMATAHHENGPAALFFGGLHFLGLCFLKLGAFLHKSDNSGKSQVVLRFLCP